MKIFSTCIFGQIVWDIFGLILTLTMDHLNLKLNSISLNTEPLKMATESIRMMVGNGLMRMMMMPHVILNKK